MAALLARGRDPRGGVGVLDRRARRHAGRPRAPDRPPTAGGHDACGRLVAICRTDADGRRPSSPRAQRGCEPLHDAARSLRRPPPPLYRPGRRCRRRRQSHPRAPSGEITFRQALDRVRSRMLDAIAHQRLPFERLVRALEPERLLGRHPLYQVMLTLVPPALSPGFAGLDVDEIPTERATSPIDLTVFIEPRGDALEAVWEYSTDLFDQTTVERLQQHFARVLEAAVSSPDTLIAELPLLTDQERERALEAWSRAGAEYPVACLHDLFERRAREDPDAPAVTYEGRTISYGELNARANRLAHRLRTLGVGPESMVGLCLRRSLDLAVAILATLKAGGAYVPLDPDYPQDRIAFVLSDTGAPVLLTQSDLLDRLPAHDAVVLCVDRDARTLEQESSENPEPLTTAESLAYVIYTSGSTGTPKGVQVEHRHVARLFTATDEWFDFGAGDTWLLFHSYAFDFSVWELWGALQYGGRLVIPPLWTTRSPEALAGLLVDVFFSMIRRPP